MLLESLPTSPPSTQTWAAIATAVAGAAAVFLKKRYNRIRRQPTAPKPDLITRTEFHAGMDSLTTKLDTNHKEVLTVLTNQGRIIEQRLDRLDTIVARLDERTKS